MSDDIDIVYTETFEHLLDKLIAYLSEFTSEVEVIERIERIIDRFEKVVSIDPLAVGLSPSLLELGVLDFREFHTDIFRIVFRTHHQLANTIVVDVIAQQKQSLEELLIQYCLLYKK